MKIWKYLIQTGDDIIKVPKRAKLLSVQSKFDECAIWFLVDPKNELEERRFITYATGDNFDAEGISYVGTFQIRGGNLVFHVFEVINAI